VALACLGFAAALGLAWGPLIHGGLPGALLPLPVLLSLGVGLWRRKPALVSAGLVMLVFLGVAGAATGKLLPAAGAVALGLASWDVALLSFRLGPAGESARIILKAQTRRAFWVAALGFALCVGLWRLRLTLPFWGLLGTLAGMWAAVVLLSRTAARLYRSRG